ncbi:MAG: flagellar motor switch protein FliM [Rhodobacteraceae bacterium]|nr:flagellar motor switch protein FliM [Paracoccaceae bacterium]
MDSAGSVLRRKTGGARPRADTLGEAAAVRALRLALGRAGQAVPGLGLEVAGLTEARLSLAELLDLPPDRALLAMIEGPGEALGLIALSSGVLATLIEAQTTGRVGQGDPAARKPTRTDAAMSAGLVDRMLTGFGDELDATADRVWAGGFRYASFLDDPRPLELLLEDTAYRVFRADLALAAGARRGEVLLALPAAGRGKAAATALPSAMAAAPVAPPPTLAEVALAAPAQLTAVLHRLVIPLSAVLALKPGDVVPVPAAALDQIVIEGLDGRRLAEGKLGQNRGHRAVRLAAAPGAAAAAAPLARPPPGPAAEASPPAPRAAVG